MKKYTEAELNRALDLIEDGYSHSEVLKEIKLNKSILVREIRKRKNLKGDKDIEEYRKKLEKENYKTYNDYLEKRAIEKILK